MLPPDHQLADKATKIQDDKEVTKKASSSDGIKNSISGEGDNSNGDISRDSNRDKNINESKAKHGHESNTSSNGSSRDGEKDEGKDPTKALSHGSNNQEKSTSETRVEKTDGSENRRKDDAEIINDVKEEKTGENCDQRGNDGTRSDESTGGDKGGSSNSVGRRGDPRMHRAVAARLANPNMSLLDALIMGGFQFPNGTDGDGKSDRNVYDADNVLLCQRKNQLSRRLRLAKRRTHETKAEVESFVRLNQAKDTSSYLFEAQKLVHGDFFTPATSGASDLQRNAALKRNYDGQRLDEHLAASRLKVSDDASLDKNSSLYGSGMPQAASISALLQHQRGLGQHQAYFAGNPYLPMHQQSLGNPFLQNQVPLNFGINSTHQATTGTNNQNPQNNLDRYLEMAASSMGMGRQAVLFPQQGVTAAHGHILNQSAIQNSGVTNKPQSDNASTQNGADTKQNTDAPQSQQDEKFELATEFFNQEKKSLI